MKTAIWIYLFIFIASFDLHAQYPILTPYAISLGAAPSFIGLMMGMYSITHVPGNLMASVWIDRFGSKIFIVCSLFIAGIILLFQAIITNPWQLLVLRSIAGFVLAFLSPAGLAILAKLSSNSVTQGKLMAGNGLVHTIASVGSPAAGALLVAQIGFSQAFVILGWILILTSLFAAIFLKKPANINDKTQAIEEDNGIAAPYLPWRVYCIPVALSCSQGILSFELPLLIQSQGSILTSGLLFSVISIGSLITLCMLFITKINPAVRTIYGSLLLAILYYILAADLKVPFMLILLMIGIVKGVIFPALSHWLILLSEGRKYGRTFSILSIAFSIGAFIGPMLAGQIRDYVSPYFIAFFFIMLAIIINGRYSIKQPFIYVKEG